MIVMRRRIVCAAAALGGASLAGLLGPRPLAAAWDQKSFDARTIQDALQLQGMAGAVASRDIVIDTTESAENAAFVPLQITSKVPDTRSISVFIDRNPWPHIARFEFGPGTVPFVALRVRVAETSAVRVVVRAGTSHYVASRNVKVAVGGCADFGSTDASLVSTRAEPVKIRARIDGGNTDLRVLVSHPMENGRRKDAGGKIAPEHFIQNLSVRLNGRTIIEAETGRSVSTNPLFAFRIQGAKANDKVSVTWHDNKGLTRTDEAVVSS